MIFTLILSSFCSECKEKLELQSQRWKARVLISEPRSPGRSFPHLCSAESILFLYVFLLRFPFPLRTKKVSPHLWESHSLTVFAAAHLLRPTKSLQTAVPCISTGYNFSLDRGNPSYCCPNNVNTGRFSINHCINRNTSHNIRGGRFGRKPISEPETV